MLELRLGRLHIVDGIAAGTMRGAGGDVQEGATRIGIDLDQFRPGGIDVEIEAHEHAGRGAIDARDVRSHGPDRILVRGRPHHLLDSIDDRLHRLDVCAVDEHG